MFYPGSLDQRKKQLLAKLAGQGRRGSGAGGGWRVGRPAGAGYGRGIGFGGGGGSAGNRAVALPQLLGGYGGGNAEYGQGGVDTSLQMGNGGIEDPGWSLTGDNNVDMGLHPVNTGQFRGPLPTYQGGNIAAQLQGPTQMQQTPQLQLLKQLIAGYGQQAPPQYAGNGRFGVM